MLKKILYLTTGVTAETVSTVVTDLTVFSRTNTNDTTVNSAGDAELVLGVKTRNFVFFVNGSFLNITGSSGFDEVVDGEALDSLILRNSTAAVDAADELNTTTVVLRTTTVTSLLDH